MSLKKVIDLMLGLENTHGMRDRIRSLFFDGHYLFSFYIEVL